MIFAGIRKTPYESQRLLYGDEARNCDQNAPSRTKIHNIRQVSK